MTSFTEDEKSVILIFRKKKKKFFTYNAHLFKRVYSASVSLPLLCKCSQFEENS